MFNYPSPPSPPPDTQEWLEQLADYYRQLVEYHQKAAMIAMNQLSHIEVLLNPLSPPTMQSSWLEETEPDRKSHTPLEQSEKAHPTTSLTETEEDNSKPIDEHSEPRDTDAPPKLTEPAHQKPVSIGTPSMMTQNIRELLEAELGKVVHINYIRRKLFPGLEADGLDEPQEWLRFILNTGKENNHWYAVPDAPDCWTFDLKSLETQTSTDEELLSTRELAELLGTTIEVAPQNWTVV
ncbi:MAG: hypothetical protein N5P05_004344 (plasmid) [Chroococcopsis gigantea SAG 12.99]|jgi:hypothetical protein|nr:hypothetical protein [Chroococcopsis gigantea SAG 12.99]